MVVSGAVAARMGPTTPCLPIKVGFAFDEWWWFRLRI
jgi:hypothetical protein